MRGEGSKAVWNFSENSSDLVAWPFPKLGRSGGLLGDRNRGVGNSLSEIQTPHIGSQVGGEGGKPRLSKINNRGQEHLFSAKFLQRKLLELRNYFWKESFRQHKNVLNTSQFCLPKSQETRAKKNCVSQSFWEGPSFYMWSCITSNFHQFLFLLEDHVLAYCIVEHWLCRKIILRT